MPAISEKLRYVETILAAGGVADPRREAASLMAFALERDRTFLIAHPEYELSVSEEDALAKIVTRRSAREPLQYITRVQEFYGLEFEVTPDVLDELLQGQSNRAIGRNLFISEDTVKSHVKAILRKLGARDRAHAVSLVLSSRTPQCSCGAHSLSSAEVTSSDI